MPVVLSSAAFACADPAKAATSWASLLGRDVVQDRHGRLVPGDDTQLGLRFTLIPPRTEPSRMHVHLTSASLEGVRATVAAALALGAGHLDVGQRPEEGHAVLADPAGNPFCVIEPGNAFLADCGFFGELACEGSRDVGIFWSAALHWPLVWDVDGETAVQSPQGGTKVACGGAPVLSAGAMDTPRFELVVTHGDPTAAVDRLVELGATRQGGGGDGVIVLADPDGVAFCILLDSTAPDRCTSVPVRARRGTSGCCSDSPAAHAARARP